MARIVLVSSSLLAAAGAAMIVADWLMSFIPNFVFVARAGFLASGAGSEKGRLVRSECQTLRHSPRPSSQQSLSQTGSRHVEHNFKSRDAERPPEAIFDRPRLPVPVDHRLGPRLARVRIGSRRAAVDREIQRLHTVGKHGFLSG